MESMLRAVAGGLTEPIRSGEGESARALPGHRDLLGFPLRPEEQAHRGGLINQRFYPELWQARNRRTELSNEEE